MKNADMPAMPVSGSDGQPIDVFSLTDGRGSNLVSSGMTVGMTKREMMAMHIMTGLCSKYGVAFETDTVQDAVRMADFLLAELERTK